MIAEKASDMILGKPPLPSQNVRVVEDFTHSTAA
jgi:hypothetical protein